MRLPCSQRQSWLQVAALLPSLPASAQLPYSFYRLSYIVWSHPPTHLVTQPTTFVPQLDGATVEGATSDDAAACQRAVTVDRIRMAGFISSLGAGATVTPHVKVNVNANADQDSTVTNATSDV